MELLDKVVNDKNFSQEQTKHQIFERILKKMSDSSFCEEFEEHSYSKELSEICGELYGNLCSIKRVLKNKWEDKNTFNHLRFFDNIGDEHSKKVIRHIEDLIFYPSEKTEEGKISYRYPLDITKIIILLYSAWLHDIGKLFWRAIRVETLWDTNEDKKDLDEIKKFIDPSTCLEDIDLNIYLSLMKYHYKISEVVLKGHNLYAADKVKDKLGELKESAFMNEIQTLTNYHIDDSGKIKKGLPASGFDPENSLLGIIAEVCGKHKDPSYVQQENLKQSFKNCDIGLLIALILMGDNSDIVEDQISKIKLDAGWGNEVLAHWVMYGCVEDVSVVNESSDVEINISYRIPKSISGNNQEYLFIRKLVESNFTNSNPIELLEGRFHGILFSREGKKFQLNLTYSIKEVEENEQCKKLSEINKLSDIKDEIERKAKKKNLTGNGIEKYNEYLSKLKYNQLSQRK